MAEINEFDDQLKDALSHLGNDISPGDWNSFAQKLNAADGFSPMEETGNFDDLIRERMESMEVNTEANSWDAMESKIDQELNAPEISDQALDQMATDQLSNLYIPYNPTHWTLMSHRLEEEFNVRRKILTYKLVEFSLMVLLLLTIVQFMPSYPGSTDINPALADNQMEGLAIKNNTTANTNIGDHPNTKVIANKNISRKSDLKSDPKRPITSSDKINIVKNLPATVVMVEDNNGNNFVSSKSPSGNVSANGKENKNEIISSGDDPASVTASQYQPAALLLTLPLTATPALEHVTDRSEIGTLKKFQNKVIVRLGAMTSADLNHIKTPNTSPYKNNGYQQYRLGYGGGITLDLNYEKLTFSTGLIYRRINYYPQEEINIAGTFTRGYQSHVFDAVNLNLLTVPMNLQFQVNNPDSKWKIHAVTGASLQLLAINHYNVTVNNLGNDNPSTLSIPPPPSPNPIEESNPVEIAREADVASEGFFEGGSFKRNHYFTANIGIGVERYISPRWSLFVQPVYQHEIFGKNMGLNGERVHTFSIQIGAKSTFK